ncbi:hypothetical protein [Bradyrhizobium elkanii]|uniref:hypothetical protein n=1 Tax=Bradyrhizobium elkanii TaxID=29448 RepID=UPI003836C0AF
MTMSENRPRKRSSKVRKKRTTTPADEPTSILADRCVELERLLAVTTVLGQQLELQRNSFVQGATSALGLLKLVASGGTIEQRTEAILAISRWLLETSTVVIVPVQWVGTEQVAKH